MCWVKGEIALGLAVAVREVEFVWVAGVGELYLAWLLGCFHGWGKGD